MSDSTLPPILLADDESDDAFILKHRLAKEGIENPVLAFLDGQELIDFLQDRAAKSEAPPRMLFLDLKMPRIDGFDTLQWIRERREYDPMTVAVVTSSSRAEDVEKATAYGAQKVFCKFPTGEQLAEVVAFSATPWPSNDGNNIRRHSKDGPNVPPDAA